VDVDWAEGRSERERERERKKLTRRLKIQARIVKTCVLHLMHINDHREKKCEREKGGRKKGEKSFGVKA
jgi:hypothetical protein